MGNTSTSMPAERNALMSRRKNVAPRAGYRVVKTANLIAGRSFDGRRAGRARIGLGHLVDETTHGDDHPPPITPQERARGNQHEQQRAAHDHSESGDHGGRGSDAPMPERRDRKSV